MAIVQGNQVKLDSGQVVTPKEGEWLDGQQYIGGSLSAPGQIHAQSGQVGAGQQVSAEVVAQTDPANVAYLQQRQAVFQPSGAGQPQGQPQAQPQQGAEGAGITTPETTLNLPELYKGLYESSGISALEMDLSTKEKEYIEAKGKINDNPFLSEASRVGREAKIEKLYQERTANLRGDIATKKADIETQLNLQTKQFDIESTAAQNALSQLNSLLGMGALDNASGEDIASITRSTGISSSMIQSAITASKNKDVSITQYDDGTNMYAIAMDSMGNIVNKQLIGPSSKTGGTTTRQKQAQSSEIASFFTQEGSRTQAEEAAKSMIQKGYSPDIVYTELDRQFPLPKTTVALDQEAISAYASMIRNGEITLANVPKEYKAEVSKIISQSSGATGEENTSIVKRIMETLGLGD